jgi:CheY-like chemotaxis protein
MKKKLSSVLLIDDDFATNFINKKIIQKAEITEHIQVVLNGKEAIDYLCNQGKFESTETTNPKPQLILLDINMPVMDGWDFATAYRDLPIEKKGKNVIVMLSSSFNPADRAKAESIEEISDFKQKTLNLEALNDILQKNFPEYL